MRPPAAADADAGGDAAGQAQPHPGQRAKVLLQLLEQHRWNVSNVAKALDVSRNTLYRKLHKLHIEVSHPDRLSLEPHLRDARPGRGVIDRPPAAGPRCPTSTPYPSIRPQALALRLVPHRLGTFPRRIDRDGCAAAEQVDLFLSDAAEEVLPIYKMRSRTCGRALPPGSA
jgi:hypothetical protein